MKNTVGSPARGDNFFKRDKEVQKILNSLNNDNNIQIAAPRRVGKTSILLHMLDSSAKGFHYAYVDTESIDSEQEFYKKLFKEILKLDGIQRVAAKFLKAPGTFARAIKSIKVAGVGVEFQDADQPLSYYEELAHFLSGIHLGKEQRLILLIDEFPQTILNIVKTGGPEAAIRFLQSNRALRLNPDICNKVRFIYTGSIGLNHTVASIDSTAFINDLNTLEIEPLTRSEASLFLTRLLNSRGISIQPTVCEYLLHKLQWLIPFHIQLIVQELLNQNNTGRSIDSQHIDQAFERITTAPNDNNFTHYYSRLKTQFEGEELKYVQEILNIASTTGSVNKTQLRDQSIRFNIGPVYKKITKILEYDGYINNLEDQETYRFNSPIIRMWWSKNIAS
jgi:hypothetical protein